MLRIPYYYSPTLHPAPSSSSPSPSPSSSSSFSDDPGLKRCVSARSRRRSLAISSLRLDPASLPSRSLLLRRRRRRRLLLWPCDASLGHGDRRGGGGDPSGGDEGDRFLQAFLLLPETARHYRLWKQGFKEEAEWKHSNRNHFSSPQGRDPMSQVKSLSHGFLRRFHSPTIFLKVVCDGDLLLPINVGEFAVKKLINDPVDDDSKECPDEFQFIKNVMGTYGYEVRMVCITERVMNTYYSRIFMGQLAGGRNISIDARPSDAINVAKNFQAPIYVNKEIVRRDAIEIIRGRWRGDNAKTIYDVSLDSAVEGPDLLAEELDLVRKMNTAIIQERYGEAAIWRDKLNKLRTPRNEP
uniref:BFN domain-containing protein n=1 Tax=Ananas comosus var. bracteatus TaxID=296719 RepID=A0A6V7PIE4_ANACO|nr:unnamed protein product [Ananas comosus var. bracteatus]